MTEACWGHDGANGAPTPSLQPQRPLARERAPPLFAPCPAPFLSLLSVAACVSCRVGRGLQVQVHGRTTTGAGKAQTGERAAAARGLRAVKLERGAAGRAAHASAWPGVAFASGCFPALLLGRLEVVGARGAALQQHPAAGNCAAGPARQAGRRRLALLDVPLRLVAAACRLGAAARHGAGAQGCPGVEREAAGLPDVVAGPDLKGGVLPAGLVGAPHAQLDGRPDEAQHDPGHQGARSQPGHPARRAGRLVGRRAGGRGGRRKRRRRRALRNKQGMEHGSGMDRTRAGGGPRQPEAAAGPWRGASRRLGAGGTAGGRASGGGGGGRAPGPSCRAAAPPWNPGWGRADQ